MHTEDSGFRDRGGQATVSAVDNGCNGDDGAGLEKTRQLVYFALCEDRIKIGISQNIGKRLSQLRTGAAAPITLLAACEGGAGVEKALHRKLRQFHIDGEWYRDCPDLRAAIQNSLNNFPAAKPHQISGRPRGRKFGDVARVLWPQRTAAHIAGLAGCDERTGKRWLAGEIEPPGIVLAAILTELTKRD